jgi:hypothetical protein
MPSAPRPVPFVARCGVAPEPAVGSRREKSHAAMNESLAELSFELPHRSPVRRGVVGDPTP